MRAATFGLGLLYGYSVRRIAGNTKTEKLNLWKFITKYFIPLKNAYQIKVMFKRLTKKVRNIVK